MCIRFIFIIFFYAAGVRIIGTRAPYNKAQESDNNNNKLTRVHVINVHKRAATVRVKARNANITHKTRSVCWCDCIIIMGRRNIRNKNYNLFYCRKKI